MRKQASKGTQEEAQRRLVLLRDYCVWDRGGFYEYLPHITYGKLSIIIRSYHPRRFTDAATDKIIALLREWQLKAPQEEVNPMTTSEGYCPVSHPDQLDKLVEWLEDRNYNQFNVSHKPDKHGNQLVSLTYKFADGTFVHRGLVGCMKSKDQNPQIANQKNAKLITAVLGLLKHHATQAEQQGATANTPGTKLRRAKVVDLYARDPVPVPVQPAPGAITLGEACPQLKTLQNQLQKPKEKTMLKSLQEDNQPKKRSKKAAPVYLNQMVKLLGSEQRAADTLGVVASTVSLGIKSAEVSAIHENAAKFWLQAHEKTVPSDRVFALVTADPQTIEFVKTVLKQFGGTLTEIGVPA